MIDETTQELDFPDDRPVRIRVTASGINLAFFHASRPLPPYNLTIPHEQWGQMVQLIAETAPRVPGFEAFVGFTPRSLALHHIDAVEIDEVVALSPPKPPQAELSHFKPQKNSTPRRRLQAFIFPTEPGNGDSRVPKGVPKV